MASVVDSAAINIVMMARMTSRIVWKSIGSKRMEDVVVPQLCTQCQAPVKAHATTGVADPLTVLEVQPFT
jgi:hypothetical protein